MNRKEVYALELKIEQLDSSEWGKQHIATPGYDIGSMRARTRKQPVWIHFGAGNIFRAFPAAVLDKLLEKGTEDTGLIVAEGFDTEIIDRIYAPCDNLSLLVTLKSDGSVEKRIVASVAEALTMEKERMEDAARLKEIFCSPALKMASFTITEKGYKLQDASGAYFRAIEEDFAAGPSCAGSYMGKVAALCYERYLAGRLPIALVSMDNFSHNGDRLKTAIQTFAKEWEQRGLAETGFFAYLQDKEKVSFPWTMIDKITPRPDEQVEKMLISDGLSGVSPIITSKHTYIAPFVNAEESQYLVIEDHFPAGRPRLEEGGMIFTSRDTVDKVERMKVCTCLNPLHTALAIYGCMLGHTSIHDEMEDEQLKTLIETMCYKEGMPVVVNPGVINPKDFADAVLQLRLPNPFMPDTPQRIACDTSQKLPIRFGETIKAYQARADLKPEDLTLIPLVLAGWCRYLMGVNDEGNVFEQSPDPRLEEVKAYLKDVKLGAVGDVHKALEPILSDKSIFAVNLYEAGLGEKVEGMFAELAAGTGAIRTTLKKYL